MVFEDGVVTSVAEDVGEEFRKLGVLDDIPVPVFE